MSLQYRGLHTAFFSKQLQRLSPKLRILYSTAKVRNFLTLPRFDTNFYDKSNVIYCFSCPNCKQKYIGRTKRILFSRITEHKRNDLGTHFNSCGNVGSFIESFTILDSTSYYTDLCTLELLYIKFHKPQLNIQLGKTSNFNTIHILA